MSGTRDRVRPANHRRRDGSEDGPRVSSGESSHNRGEPLPAPTLARLEGAFGHSFADVDVHADEESDDVAREHGALALAAGRDMYFRDDAFAPESPAGFFVLAHEAAHIVQHDRGSAGENVADVLEPVAHDAARERDAHRAAFGALTGAGAHVSETASAESGPQPFFDDLVGMASGALGMMTGGVSDLVGSALGSVGGIGTGNLVAGIGGTLGMGGAGPAGDLIGAGLGALGGVLGGGGGGGGGGGLGGILGGLGGIGGGLGGIVGGIGGGLGDLLGGIGGGIGGGLGGIGAAAGGGLGGILGGIGAAAEGGLGGILGGLGGGLAGGGLGGILGGAGGGLGGILGGVSSGIGEALGGMFGGIGGGIGGMFDGASGWLEDAGIGKPFGTSGAFDELPGGWPLGVTNEPWIF
jgi:hypothetical protein